MFICRGCCNRYHRGQGGSLNNRKLLSQLWRPEVQGQGVSGAGSFWKLCALPAPWAPAPWRPSVPGLMWPSLTSSLHLLSCPGGLPSVTGTPWLLLYLPSLPSSSRDLLPVCVCVCLQTSPFYKGYPDWIRTQPKNPPGIEPTSPALGGGFFIMSRQGSPTETHFKCFLELRLKGDFRLSIPCVWGFHSG